MAVGLKPKAEGVIFEDGSGGKHMAFLKKESSSEIILSAGALGSPQLLLLSGVGPAPQLEALGIKVVLNQPMVGQGMADNPLNGLIIPSPTPVEISPTTIVGITKFGNYIESMSGYDFSALSSAGAPQSSVNDFTTTTNLGFIFEKVDVPSSRGYLELRNTNASDTPKVKFNYFHARDDLMKCVQGMKTIIDVVNSKSYSKFRYRNTTTQDLLIMMASMRVNQRPKRPNNSTVSLEQYCMDTVKTIWHYHGGCQVGKVVDGDYKVLGVDGLRVVDGSTFNFSPGTNPSATLMMLGRYMGRRILQSRRI